MPEFPDLQTSRNLLRKITERGAEDRLRIHSDQTRMVWFGEAPLTDLSEAKCCQSRSGLSILARPSGNPP